jgi:hypothetical protein
VFRALMDPRSKEHEDLGPKFALLVDQLEQFVVGAGRKELPRKLPVRAVLMHLIVGSLSRAAMGPIGDRLWRGDSHTREIAAMLLLGKR